MSSSFFIDEELKKVQNDFTIKLLTLLKEKKLSQKDLARLLKAKEPLVSRWITGKAKPTNKSILAICKVLGLPFNYFDDNSRFYSNINNSNIGNNNTITNNDARIELLEEKVKRLELEIELLKRKK